MNTLTTVNNWKAALKNHSYNLTGVFQSLLQSIGDYELAVFSVAPHTKQRAHYHTYGDIDIFMVVAGQGVLHLAKVENNKIVNASDEQYQLSAGDTYKVTPYTLHAIENSSDEPIIVLNIAPGAHSAPMEGKVQHVVDIFFPEK